MALERLVGAYAACCSAMAYSGIVGVKRGLQDLNRTAMFSAKIKTAKILTVNIFKNIELRRGNFHKKGKTPKIAKSKLRWLIS